MFWRSKDILQFPEWALVRGLYKSMGYSDYDLSRPLIGIANSWNRVVPGHYNLNLVSDYVKQGIFQAGGTPVEFGTIAVLDATLSMKETNVMIGGKLGRYEILDVLGRGGQSIAYRARDPKIDRIEAVKQILSKKSLPEKDRAEFHTRFMRESQAAGRLSHPNIATIYDVGGDEEGEPYIAMEYVDGSDLDELIRREHPLSQERVLRLFVQLCSALDYAHDAGIVHRDIKPGNIMVTRGDRVKVVDFGIAKMDSSSLTQVGMVMGGGRASISRVLVTSPLALIPSLM